MLTWSSLSDLKVCMGEGVFGKCYLVQIGLIMHALKYCDTKVNIQIQKQTTDVFTTKP